MVNITTQKEIWINKASSSTRFCSVETDIIKRNGRVLEVCYEMHCTMIDGSVANVISNTNSSSRCFSCKSSPTQINKIYFVREPNVDNYKFGLSTLHSWIRFLEFVLHIAYRGEFLEKKKTIQHQFKTRMGLVIDQVKSGFGTTNDGNTARRFFEKSAISAEITGINKDLIENFHIILRVLFCGIQINNEKFQELLITTRNIYLSHYSWFYMPSSVHKVLIHGCDVFKFFDIPIGCLSEEAFEANHKNVRKVRLSHTRKSSRANTKKDLMTHLLLASDPVLSSNRKLNKKTNKINDEELEKYLVKESANVEIYASSSSSESEESSDDQ